MDITKLEWCFVKYNNINRRTNLIQRQNILFLHICSFFLWSYGIPSALLWAKLQVKESPHNVFDESPSMSSFVRECACVCCAKVCVRVWVCVCVCERESVWVCERESQAVANTTGRSRRREKSKKVWILKTPICNLVEKIKTLGGWLSLCCQKIGLWRKYLLPITIVEVKGLMASTVELFDHQSWCKTCSLEIPTFPQMVSKYFEIIFARIVLVYLY